METAGKFASALGVVSDPTVWLFTLAGILSLAAYQNYVNYYTYWERRNVKGLKPIVPVLPEIWAFLTKNRLKTIQERTKKFGKIYGTFFMGRPQLIVNDPEVIKQMTTKDFDYFQDHQLNEWSNKYQRNFLIWLRGEHWRRVRALMTPTFTSAKIRRMYALLEGCAQDMLQNFREQIEAAAPSDEGDKQALVDLYNSFGMYSMDGITTCCYGMKLKRAGSIEQASSRDVFVRDASQVFGFSLLRFVFAALLPKFLFKYEMFSFLMRRHFEPLAERVNRLIELRRKNIKHKYDDLLQLLIEADLDAKLELSEMDQKENHHAGLTEESLLSDQKRLVEKVGGPNGIQTTVKLTEFEVLAESMFLLAAGLDTTRSSLSTICYLLAHNQPVQERLVFELKKIAKYGEQESKVASFDYEALTSCEYLDAVISESLRMFGPVAMLDRIALDDYTIEKYQVQIPKGSRLLFGLHSVHNDPDYWDEPEKFKPERFLPGQREKIIPGSYIPFSMGPRHCIGMRFSLTETKLGLAKLLVECQLKPGPGNIYPPEPNFGLGLLHVRDCKVLVSRRP